MLRSPANISLHLGCLGVKPTFWSKDSGLCLGYAFSGPAGVFCSHLDSHRCANVLGSVGSCSRAEPFHLGTTSTEPQRRNVAYKIANKAELSIPMTDNCTKGRSWSIILWGTFQIRKLPMSRLLQVVRCTQIYRSSQLKKLQTKGALLSLESLFPLTLRKANTKD